ncbi:glycosyltransferase [Paenibacillus terrae HPL-003]|uniref:Glycosyltransferase n=1 Tax=Paenibacillus terrae (strain HPL-003) TaxID=985665 RepID=G7VQ57_PAETH|nr:glycosyltransferase family 4 protein [Paenibacillus terrae]AET61126.1 glycosyltransferase [Paenibacillus terrae HPL-003]
MKLLFTFFNPSGGMETLNRIRCRALIKQGIECHLLYTLDGDGKKNIKGIPTFIFSDETRIRALIERQNYDAIIVCTDIQLLYQIRMMGYEGPMIFEIQGMGTYENARAILSDFSGRILSYADALLYPETSHLKKLLTEMFPAMMHFCFDDPLDTESFGYSSYPPKPFPIIGWIGRIERNKNWRDFLNIGAALKLHYPDLYMWMFDDAMLFEPDELADFDHMVCQLNLSDRLIRQSNVPHEMMADYLSLIGDSGGFLCSTSITEGFGYAVAEAMICRCPVVTTDSDGVRAFLYPGKTGLLYQRGNIDQAVQAGISIMENKSLRSKLILRAEKLIKKRFSTVMYVNQFKKMLINLKDRHGQKRANSSVKLNS